MTVCSSKARPQVLSAVQHLTRSPSPRNSRSAAQPANYRTKAAAARSPCILITAPDGIDNSSLQFLAQEVRHHLGVSALIVAPSAVNDLSAHQHRPNSNASASAAAAAAAAAPSATAMASLTFQQQLKLQPHPQHDMTFSLAAATAADCVLCAVDQTCGLMQALGLNPVMVLVGVSRNPALSSDMDHHPAVAVARHAALLGLPAVAACLATTSAGAPVQPAVAATVQLLSRLLLVLQHTTSSSSSSSSRGWQPSSKGLGNSAVRARNFPRAHFPFPEEGRWALGTQLPLPQGSAAASGSSSTSSWQSYDCWALGDDNSWLGDYTSRNSSSSSSSSSSRDGNASRKRVYRTLQGAFADGDLLLCLNVPPNWQESAGIAATRPGVLWHCWQVEAQQQQQQQQQFAQPVASSSSSSSSSSGTEGEQGTASPVAAAGRWSHLYSNSNSRSWQVDSQDLYGRTLPSSGYGSQVPMGSNFVGQDNTRAVLADNNSRSDSSWRSTTDGTDSLQQQQQQQQEGCGVQRGASIPSSFVVQRGTLLNDAAACGDVEAVFAGRAALTVCQSWPAGHPLTVRDEVLLAGLDQVPGGLMPAWLEVPTE